MTKYVNIITKIKKYLLLQLKYLLRKQLLVYQFMLYYFGKTILL